MPKANRQTKVVSFRIDPDRLSYLLQHVPSRYRTVSNLVRHGIDRIIANPEPRDL
jgi:hypothetical protein